MKVSMPFKGSIVETTFVGAFAVIAGGSAGFWLSCSVPEGALISFLKYATVVLGVVWIFSMIIYNKLSDLTEIPGIDYKQHRGLESAIQVRLRWFWFRAGALAIAGLTANLPTFLVDGGIKPAPLIFSVAAGALALGLFLLRRVWAELEEIRQLRSEVKELERREQLRAKQIDSLKKGAESWDTDPTLTHGPKI